MIQPYARLHIASHEQVRRAVSAAQAAYVDSTLTPHDRGAILDRVARPTRNSHV
jgi:succinate-semialdehyde dehydrogenase/glutarate-semialdehyde dehydrogenase